MPDSDGFIVSNVPLSTWVPLAVLGISLSRDGWVYQFAKRATISSKYWVVVVKNGTDSFSGRILAFKI